MSNMWRNKVRNKAKMMFVKVVTVWKRLSRALCIEGNMSRTWWRRFYGDEEKVGWWGFFIRVHITQVSALSSSCSDAHHTLALPPCSVFSLCVTKELSQYVLSVSIELLFSCELCCDFVSHASHLFPLESEFHLQWINTHILYPSRPIDYILSPAICLIRK